MSGRGRVPAGWHDDDDAPVYQPPLDYWDEYFACNTHLGDGRQSNPPYPRVTEPSGSSNFSYGRPSLPRLKSKL